jgi:hypothetical protein
MPNGRPIVTLITDFGLLDHYAAAMKAAILRQCPEATLVDVTHQVPPGDIVGGSFVLGQTLEAFDPGTIHLAVVDPGVGTDRRLLVASLNGQQVVCPDNGLLTWAWRACATPLAAEITWRPAETSSTFHGRDVLGPVAGKLAAGNELASLSRPIIDPILSPIEPARIVYIDHYGNAIANLDGKSIDPAANVHAGGMNVGKIRRAYSDVPMGQPIALINSSGLLEIAVRQGSAANLLGLKVGDGVYLS